MIIRTFLFALAVSCWTHAEEIIPGVLTFNSPTNFDAFESGGDPGDNPFSGAGRPRRYLSHDGKQIDINVRLIGFSIGEGKSVTYSQLDDTGVKQEMSNFCKSLPNITNMTAVAETKLGGQKAFSVTFHAIVRDYGNHIYGDLYWVRVETNRVVEIELSTGSDKSLTELRQCLAGFKIKKSYSK